MLKHTEENMTIVMVTDVVMNEGEYFHYLEGEVEETDIIELIRREYPEQSTQLIYSFDEA